MNSRKYIACLCLCYAASVAAQTLVYLEHSETLSFDQERIANAQILRGNVIFRHEDALMYCDSAYFYDQENSLDAFGHVRFEQGDTLKGYGDKLFYDGNTKLARLRRHVRLQGKAKTVVNSWIDGTLECNDIVCSTRAEGGCNGDCSHCKGL